MFYVQAYSVYYVNYRIEPRPVTACPRPKVCTKAVIELRLGSVEPREPSLHEINFGDVPDMNAAEERSE